MTGAEPNKFSHGWGDFAGMLDVLETGIGSGPWLLGERFSAADVMVGSAVHFLAEAGAMPESRSLEAYVSACLARPAYQRTLAADAAIENHDV